MKITPRKSTALSKAYNVGKYMNLKECREYRVWISTVSDQSAKMYTRCFSYFIKFSQGTKTPINLVSDLNKMSKEKVNMLLEDYMLSIRHKKHGTVRLYLAAIESYLKYHEIPYSERKIIKLLPIKKKLAGSEAYELETIQKMYRVATTPRAKMVILLLACSAMRRGGIADLKIKDMKPMEDCYMFIVHSGEIEEYFTFCTPECRKAIDDYIAYREERGERITPESPLFQTRSGESGDTRYMVSSTIEGILKKAKIQREKIGNRYTISEVHGFRKFTSTQMNNADLGSNKIEKISGRKNNLKGRYYDARQKELFEEYKTVIPYLTILEVNRQKSVIKDLKNKTVVDEVAISKEVANLSQKLQDALQEIEGLKRILILTENELLIQKKPVSKTVTFADTLT
ncbi:integrase family protein [Marine Group I thaumarchaeote SCGC AAA799-E16]|uniref:Integrase family protein n=1 Tax=Marine Group I thaumarchaeote SCGC AAA799-E16 TaxID=1502292 RepID=A0A081S4V8_9ARCH|nr:integrase family protein [Marine Group I thaumarchaeote SCGC AAA799-E16]